MTETAVRRLMLFLSTGKIRAAQEKTAVQTSQVQLNDKEIIDNLPNIAHYGFHSFPSAGSDAVVLFLSGDRSKGVILGTADQRCHVQLVAGEVILHDDQGTKIHLSRDGIIVDGGGRKITLTNTPSVRAETALLEVTGDIKDNCDTHGRTMSGDREIYNRHEHQIKNVMPGGSTVISEIPDQLE